MKAEKWTTSLFSALIAFCLALGGMGCLATGFALDANLLLIGISAALAAVVFSLCFRARVGLFPLGAFALLMGFLWQKGDLAASCEAFLYEVSVFYQKGYGWGTISWSEEEFFWASSTAALCLLGCLVVIAVTWTVSQRRMLWLAAAASFAPLAVCMGLTDTVPGEAYLFLWLAGLLMLILPQSVRRRSAVQGNILTAASVLPILLALALLFTLVPQDTYQGQARAEQMGHFLMQWFQSEDAGGTGGTGGTGNGLLTEGDQGTNVSLSDLGPRNNPAETVMTVKTDYSGTMYLRGASYDHYDGTTWTASGRNAWDLAFLNTGELYDLTVSTLDAHSVIYLPYAPVDLPYEFKNGRVSNDDRLTGYTFSFSPLAAYDESWDEISFDMSYVDMRQYLQLPEETEEAAKNLMRLKIGLPKSTDNAGQNWKNACTIADFVRSSAHYSLQTQAPPEGTEDFALWFLKESDTGYCVHYATATVVLLRAAGIPARYVSGYLVTARAGETVDVQMRDAHAWVECYIGGIGWVVLEPTPSAGLAEPPDPTEPPTDPTDPSLPETTAPTGPTDPQPSDPTGPNGETLPSTPETTGPNGETLPADTETPSAEDGISGGQSTGGTDAKWLLVLLQIILSIAGAAALILGQWQLRVSLRRKLRRQGSSNRQALYRWRELERLHRLTKTKPEDAMYALAEKARFSQHSISTQELSLFNAARAQQQECLRQKNFLWQLWYRLVLALY